MVEQGIVAYDLSFDRKAYQLVETADKEKLDTYTRRQLETHLGERFNVLLSTTRYEIKNGQIFGEDANEPFMDMLIRGRNYRRLYGNPIDFAREEAEVLGFGKVEARLASPNAEINAKMVSISQPGTKGPTPKESSIYKHNFYDIFTLKQDERGRFIEARRYSSGLSLEETAGKLKAIGLLDPQTNPAVEEFLENPIEVKPQAGLLTADSIHEFLHKEHQYTEKQEFDEALGMMGFLITSYVNSLADNPLDENDHIVHLNAVLNGYDRAMNLVQRKGKADIMEMYAVHRLLNSQANIFMLGRQPVRKADTGCGPSGGFITNSPFSVAESGKVNDWKSNEKTILCCTCPFCEKQVEAEISEGKITCPECDKSAPYVQQPTKYLI